MPTVCLAAPLTRNVRRYVVVLFGGFGMVGKILFWSVVITAFLLSVTASHIVGKDNLFFGVDITDKGAWTVALRATVSAAGIAVRLESKSELTHNRL